MQCRTSVSSAQDLPDFGRLSHRAVHVRNRSAQCRASPTRILRVIPHQTNCSTRHLFFAPDARLHRLGRIAKRLWVVQHFQTERLCLIRDSFGLSIAIWIFLLQRVAQPEHNCTHVRQTWNACSSLVNSNILEQGVVCLRQTLLESLSCRNLPSTSPAMNHYQYLAVLSRLHVPQSQYLTSALTAEFCSDINARRMPNIAREPWDPFRTESPRAPIRNCRVNTPKVETASARKFCCAVSCFHTVNTTGRHLLSRKNPQKCIDKLENFNDISFESS